MTCGFRPLILALLLSLGFATAASAEWRFVRVSGLVWVVAEGMEPARAEVGMALPDNATIGTTSKGRAMLQQGEDILNVAPGTVLAPQARKIRGLTTVLMNKGRLDLAIEKLGRPHFAVQTPFLAAVVKGTHFTVEVGKGNAGVAVSEGRVEVTDFASGQRADIVGGQAAKTGSGGLEVSGVGTLPEIQKTATQSPLIPAASAASVSDAATESSSVSSAAGTAASTAGTTADTATTAATSVTSSVAGTVRSVTANVNASFNRGTGSGTSNGNSASSNAGGKNK